MVRVCVRMGRLLCVWGVVWALEGGLICWAADFHTTHLTTSHPCLPPRTQATRLVRPPTLPLTPCCCYGCARARVWCVQWRRKKKQDKVISVGACVLYERLHLHTALIVCVNVCVNAQGGYGRAGNEGVKGITAGFHEDEDMNTGVCTSHRIPNACTCKQNTCANQNTCILACVCGTSTALCVSSLRVCVCVCMFVGRLPKPKSRGGDPNAQWQLRADGLYAEDKGMCA